MGKKEKASPAGGRSGPGYLETVALTVLISLAVAALAVGFYDQRYAQKVVMVDLKGYIQQQRDRLLAGEIDDNGLRAAFDTMEDVMAKVPDNHVVILKEVVLRNAQEVEFKP